jgi:hypothetical protein
MQRFILSGETENLFTEDLSDLDKEDVAAANINNFIRNIYTDILNSHNNIKKRRGQNKH